LAIIDHGRIVVKGAPQALKAELGGDIVKLVLGADNATVHAQCERAAEILTQDNFVDGVSVDGSKLSIVTRQGGRALPRIIRVLDEANISVQDMAMTSPTLDDVFLKHTGSRIRDDASVQNWRNAFGPGGRGRRSIS
jgi:ABC-2 type transport system ATP-binding protein